MWERDLIWFTGEREHRFALAVSDWAEGAHAHKAEYWAERHTAPLRSHPLVHVHADCWEFLSTSQIIIIKLNSKDKIKNEISVAYHLMAQVWQRAQLLQTHKSSKQICLVWDRSQATVNPKL